MPRPLDRRAVLARLAILGTGLGIAFGARAWAGAPRIGLMRHRIGSPRDGARPLRVVGLADLHANAGEIDGPALAGIVERTNALSPDLVFLLGDYCSQQPGALPPETVAAALAGLGARLGVYAVQGNHDWHDDPAALRDGTSANRTSRAFADAGIRLVDDEALEAGPGLWVAGLASEYAPAYAATRASGRDLDEARLATLDRILAPVPPGDRALLLAHEPDIFATRLHPRVAATFSGHTHGGQVRLLGWSPLIPSRYGGRYARGHVVEEGRHLVVSAGLGSHFVAGRPLRIGVPRELVLTEIWD